MSVIQKLRTLKQKYPDSNEIPLEKHDLIDLLGERYKEGELPFSHVISCYFFEEDNVLYYLAISKEKNEMFSIRDDVNEKLLYTKVREPFIVMLNRRMNNHNLLRFGDSVERQLKVIENVLNHPSVRLKQLFS